MTYQIIATSYAGTLNTLRIRTGRPSVRAALTALEQVSCRRGLVTKPGADGEHYVGAATYATFSDVLALWTNGSIHDRCERTSELEEHV